MAAPAAAALARRAAVAVAGGVFGGRDGESGPAKVLAAVATCLVIGVFMVCSAPAAMWSALTGTDDGELSFDGAAWAGSVDADADWAEQVRWYRARSGELLSYAEQTWNSSGHHGEDTYSVPDWKVLMAFDMAVSENQFDLVKANKDYYDELHRALLKATSVPRTAERIADSWEEPGEWATVTASGGTRTYYEPAGCWSEETEREAPVYDEDTGVQVGTRTETATVEHHADGCLGYSEAFGCDVREVTEDWHEDGAYWDGSRWVKDVPTGDGHYDDAGEWVRTVYEDGAYVSTDQTNGLAGQMVVAEHYTTWAVTFTDPKTYISRSAGAGTLSDAFKFFAYYENHGEYGGTWGDEGNALGYYQFDRRYALDDFLGYVTERYPGTFDYLKPWANVGEIAQGDAGLEAAWQRAWSEHPSEWAAAQDDFEYQNYYVPARDLLESMGIHIDDRHDALKGVVCGMGNAGLGNAKRYFQLASLSDSMTDAEMITALCDAYIENPPAGYEQGFINRYTAEKAEALRLLETSPAGSRANAVTAIGSNPDAEGKALAIKYKGELYANYKRALGALDVKTGSGGNLVVTLDKERFTTLATQGSTSGSGSSEVVARAEAEIGIATYVWGACNGETHQFDCSGFVAWCLTGVSQRLGTTDTYVAWPETDDPKPGDVCVYSGPQYEGGGHCGIYVGDGKMIDCSAGVAVRDVDPKMTYHVYEG